MRCTPFVGSGLGAETLCCTHNWNTQHHFTCLLPPPLCVSRVIEEELRGIAREVKRQQAPRRPAIPLPRSGSRPGLPIRRRNSGGGGTASRAGGGLLRQGSGSLARQGSQGLSALGGGMGAGMGLVAAAAMQRPVSSGSLEGPADARQQQMQQQAQLPNGVGQNAE